MGPDRDTLEKVKRDSIQATAKHFRNEENDNKFEAEMDLDDVEKSLLLENGGYVEPKRAKKTDVQPTKGKE